MYMVLADILYSVQTNDEHCDDVIPDTNHSVTMLSFEHAMLPQTFHKTTTNKRVHTPLEVECHHIYHRVS
jgi:hypothetical protein